MSRNLASNLTDTAERHGDKLAIKLDDFELNYQLLNEGSARVAGMLGTKGVGAGGRVGKLIPQGPGFPRVYSRIQRRGVGIVPRNPRPKGR